MKLLTAALALTLSGCAGTHRLNLQPPSNDYRVQACRVAHYCGPDAGVILYGDQVCYTDHLSQDGNFWVNGKWEARTPKDLVCR